MGVSMAIENDGDREKAAELYKLYSSIMLYIAKSILHDHYLAEDAVIEAFIKIMDNLNKINKINCSQTRRFVAVIVRNVAFDFFKHRNRCKEVPIDNNLDYLVTEKPILDKFTTKEACSKITDAITKLNKNYFDILYLKIKFDYSNKEISKILKISEDNVKMRLSRASKGLKEKTFGEGILL